MDADILIIDDDRELADMLREFLAPDHFHVTANITGEEGLVALREERYDLVVLDTPPSRNALDFLYGPSRLSAFLDGRIFQLFLPGERRGLIRRAASRSATPRSSCVGSNARDARHRPRTASTPRRRREHATRAAPRGSSSSGASSATGAWTSSAAGGYHTTRRSRPFTSPPRSSTREPPR